MSDTSFGSGLQFGGGPGASGADVTPSPGGPVDLSPPNPQPALQTPQGGFGSGFGKMLGGPDYHAPDPQMSAIDQTADTLQQRVKRANDIANNPVLQFFNPEGVQKARDFVPKATEELEKLRGKQADIKAGRQQAETLGLHPGDYTDESSQADRVEVAKARALKGDLNVFKGLQVVDPKAAEAIQDQVHEVVSGHLSKAQLAFDRLSSVRGNGEYTAAIDMMRKDGTLTDLEALGLKVPRTVAEFDAVKAREGQALREARIGVAAIRQKLEERNTYQPMEEKEAKTYNGRMTTAYGDQITNGTWSRNAAAGTRGFVVNGAADPRELGKSFTFATPEQRKSIKEEFEHAVPKEDLEKYRAFNRTYQLATTDAKGNKLKDDQINTNPNVQQGIAEGLASMLRGGSGGANVGLIKIEGSKRAYVQSLLDNIKANYAGGVNTLTGDTVKPYLTNLTQKQVRDVMDALHAYNQESIGSRTEQIANRAGALGLDSAALGFGKGENAGAVDDAIKAGRDAQIARMLPMHQAIGGGDGVFQLGAQRPGQGATGLPPGTQPNTQLPGPERVATPVQQAAAAPVPGGPAASPPSSPGGGGGAPITVAGQPITPPSIPGASADFVPKLQRIESGNEKDPWTAGSNLSSAGGAYQFIKSTWAANKPAGAPDDPRKATPEQQTAALATLTAKNASALSNARVPVNDTTLYVAHNLGAGGATSLLSASPTADARSIVGEAAARNNPMFFKGRPTVATVLQRYQEAMNAPSDNGPKPRTPSTGAVAEQPKTFMQRMLAQAGQAGDAASAGSLERMNPEELAQVEKNAQDALPIIGSTAGAVGGSIVGGPVGGAVGGGVGGGAGQWLKDKIQGREQSPTEIAKQTALGTVLGVSSVARPIAAAGARVVGSAAVNAGAEALKGGSTADVIDKATEGGGYALGGELLGRFISALGPVAHKVLSNYLPSAQAELSAQAGKLAEARAVLAKEEPKLAGANGASTPNPAYEAAKATEEKATKYIKDHNQSPDDMVYAYEQAKSGVSAGEALTMRKANSEKEATSQAYNELRTQVKETGVGAPKPNQPVPDGPVSMLRTAENPTGKVEARFQPEAEHAEMLIKAPAKDFGEKWTQLQNAGTELIKKRMDFMAAGEKTSADAMNTLFEGVRNQQKAVAEYVFGKEAGKKVISHLEELDTRYAKVMSATQGMNYEKMRSTLAQGNTPAARELEKNFREFAKDDPSALRAFNAMKAGAKGDWKTEAALMGPVIAGEVAANLHGVPTVGAISALVGGHRLYKMVQGYMNAKILGTPVTFKDFLAKEIKNNPAGDAVRTGVERGALQTQ